MADLLEEMEFHLHVVGVTELGWLKGWLDSRDVNIL